jgi:hypothetical protein
LFHVWLLAQLLLVAHLLLLLMLLMQVPCL